MIPDDAQANLEEYITAYVDLGFFSGSVLVAQGDNVLVSKGYGLANHDQDIANTPSTKFNIGGLTYSFTAMAIMQLQEQGLLLVDDTVSKYLPDFPNGESMTIHNLLTLGSGLYEYTLLPSFETVESSPTSFDTLIGLFRDEGLASEIGFWFDGPNSGYVLLGAIIEQVSGMSYGDYLQKHIFEPLGMADSGYNMSLDPAAGKAVGYIYMGDEPVVEDPIDMSNGFSAFGVYSTVEDLYRWDRALYTEQLLGKGGLDDLFTNYREVGSIVNFAYGWNIRTINRRTTTSWNGAIGGFKTVIARFVDDDIVIIVLGNSSLSPVTQMTLDIPSILEGLRYTIPEERIAREMDTDRLDAFVGEYRYGGRSDLADRDEYEIIEVTREGEALFIQLEDLPAFQIFPETRTKFFTNIANIEIDFTKTDLAGVMGVIIRQDGDLVIHPTEFNIRKVRLDR